ncbi:MAG: protein kinase domain-containing protein [Planctomycetota bacterium]
MFESLQQDQKSRWEKGDRVPVAFYLKQYPELRRDLGVFKLLVLEEMRLRESAGEPIDKEAFLREYPECRDVIDSYQSTFETVSPSLAQFVQTTTPAPDPNATLAPAPYGDATVLYEPAPATDEFATMPAASTTTSRAIAREPSAIYPVIPGFEILSELGRGGMGIVFRARQISANRIVALKIVRNDQLDMLPPKARADALGRFTTEAHAAASLQHDNLVSVYEVGEVPSKTPGGTPLHYYAMRFVQGDSLFDLVRDGPLENRRAAAYIQKVASALQAAHDQGILHRDMKPHNVMIEKGSDRPLVTDFGLAKIVDSGNTMTYAGQVMGTPSYMSPEQAVDAGNVTPAADQYSIGATLYHILTGRPPFVASSVPDTIRQILDKQPVSLRELNSSVHRDLETICLKSIQKDPVRRYANCKDLADDLQRYLDGVPIVARPVGRAERLWRWCRRNPGTAAMIGSVAILALSTMAAIVIGYRNTSAALAVSESRLEKALQVVDELFTRVSEDELLNEPGMQPLRRELLEKALKHYQYFLSESGGSSKLADEVASAHYRVGMIQQLTGNLESAESELKLALDQQQSLMSPGPDRANRLKALSDTFNALGSLFNTQHRPKDSVAMFEASWNTRRQLAELVTDDLEYQRLACNSLMNLGVAKIALGNHKDGLIDIRKAQDSRIALLEREPDQSKLRRDLARGWYSLGKFSFEQGDVEAAVGPFEQSVDEFRRLLDQDARSLSYRFDGSLALRMLGSVYSELGNEALATEIYEEAARLARKLNESNPDVLPYKTQLAVLSMSLGTNYEQSEQWDKADEAWTQALRLERELLASSAEDPDIQADFATCLTALGDLALRRGDSPNAKEYLQEALPILRTLNERNPSNTMFEEHMRRVELQLKDLAE